MKTEKPQYDLHGLLLDQDDLCNYTKKKKTQKTKLSISTSLFRGYPLKIFTSHHLMSDKY